MENCVSIKPKEGFPGCCEGYASVPGDTGRTGIPSTESESEVWKGLRRADLRSWRKLWPSHG